MPSKKKKNSYFYFMVSYKENLIKKGTKPLPTMNELAAICDPLWKEMTPDQRSFFDPKNRPQVEKVTKYNSFGISFDDLEKEKMEKETLYLAMVNEIKETVKSLDNNTIKRHPFYLIHINNYCVTQSGVFIPAELAICEFSFKTGVSKNYHVLINPLRIPLGYMSVASQLAQETHGLPMPGDLDKAESDYKLIYTSIVSFLEPNPFKKSGFKYPPMYTLEKNVPGVKYVLNTLFLSVYPDGDEDEAFRVFSLEKLFFSLRNATAKEGEEFPSEGIAHLEFEKDIYSFASGIACGFHEGGDCIPYCSLSCVKRWGFLMADFCCKNLKIPLIPGVHCTLQADVNRNKSNEENNKKIICPQCINEFITNYIICKDCVKCFLGTINRTLIGNKCGECNNNITEDILDTPLMNHKKQVKSCLFCTDND